MDETPKVKFFTKHSIGISLSKQNQSFTSLLDSLSSIFVFYLSDYIIVQFFYLRDRLQAWIYKAAPIFIKMSKL